MAFEEKVARVFAMSDDVWLRHANPWSGWTRFSVLPLFVVSVWSRVWIGWWALPAVAAVLLWTWINPRLFRPPRSTDNWMSRAVLGERVWLNRSEHPIPAHHFPVLRVTKLIIICGLLVGAYGLVVLEVWPTVTGTALCFIGKSWFMDRMVWLYQEMGEKVPRYGKWLY